MHNRHKKTEATKLCDECYWFRPRFIVWNCNSVHIVFDRSFSFLISLMEDYATKLAPVTTSSVTNCWDLVFFWIEEEEEEE